MTVATLERAAGRTNTADDWIGTTWKRRRPHPVQPDPYATVRICGLQLPTQTGGDVVVMVAPDEHGSVLDVDVHEFTTAYELAGIPAPPLAPLEGATFVKPGAKRNDPWRRVEIVSVEYVGGGVAVEPFRVEIAPVGDYDPTNQVVLRYVDFTAAYERESERSPLAEAEERLAEVKARLAEGDA